MPRYKYSDTFITTHGTRVKVRVNVPAKCKTPKRICIKCKVTALHKLSKLYDGRICSSCLSIEESASKSSASNTE